MDRSRYLELLAADGRLLADQAGRDLAAPIPSCPGWTVRDVVEHTAEVYEHKIACILLGGTRPDPWPPPWPADRDVLGHFADAHTRLLDVLSTTDPAAPSWTWLAEDQTASFWVRRMAQETAVHRVDVESAFGQPTPVDAELARDGVEEVLLMMLAGDWSEDIQAGSSGTIEVATDGRVWRVVLAPDRIGVERPPVDGDGDRAGDDEGRAAARVSGEPSDVLLWLWGRAPQSVLTVSGDRAVVARLRERLVLATQ